MLEFMTDDCLVVENVRLHVHVYKLHAMKYVMHSHSALPCSKEH